MLPPYPYIQVSLYIVISRAPIAFGSGVYLQLEAAVVLVQTAPLMLRQTVNCSLVASVLQFAHSTMRICVRVLLWTAGREFVPSRSTCIRLTQG